MPNGDKYGSQMPRIPKLGCVSSRGEVEGLGTRAALILREADVQGKSSHGEGFNATDTPWYLFYFNRKHLISS